MSNRLVRVGELLKRELSNCIDRELEFSGVLVTIHAVEVAPDLRNADVFVGVVGGEEGQMNKVIEILETNRGLLQRKVMKRVVLKYTPRLHFHPDHSVERGVDVVALLDSLEGDPDPDAEVPADGFGEDLTDE